MLWCILGPFCDSRWLLGHMPRLFRQLGSTGTCTMNLVDLSSLLERQIHVSDKIWACDVNIGMLAAA